jgi:hypothetical protein
VLPLGSQIPQKAMPFAMSKEVPDDGRVGNPKSSNNKAAVRSTFFENINRYG